MPEYVCPEKAAGSENMSAQYSRHCVNRYLPKCLHQLHRKSTAELLRQIRFRLGKKYKKPFVTKSMGERLCKGYTKEPPCYCSIIGQ